MAIEIAMFCSKGSPKMELALLDMRVKEVTICGKKLVVERREERPQKEGLSGLNHLSSTSVVIAP
jgi:hypothetical protein